jgi:G3E family GTPase
MASPPPAKKQKVAIADLLAPAPPRPPQSDDAAAPALLTADGTWAAAYRIQSQMPTFGIPLTILTGFLGSGKTTILNYILSRPHNLKIAVLINEYGAIDIDSKLIDSATAFKEGDPVVLDNGCICCNVSNGFIDAIRRILESPRAPDYIIVETTGVADPKPVIDSIQETELRDEVYVDQVLTTVDSSAWTPVHYGSPTAKRQIESADTVLLTKTDLVKEASELQAVISSVREIRPNSRILRSQAGYVPVHALFDLAVTPEDGTDVAERSHAAERNNDDVSDQQKASCHDGHQGDGACCHESHKHTEEDGPALVGKTSHLEEEGFSSVSFKSSKPLSMTRFRRDFMEQLPDEVFRAKGLLWFSSYSSKFIFHWSGSRYNVEEGEWSERAEKLNQLVVIGRNMDGGKIRAMFEACILQPGEEDDDESEEETCEGDDLRSKVDTRNPSPRLSGDGQYED